ncbi:hypothetical protein E2P63_03910 [Candidatus Bathyarchaeota archaeon]|nr:hypothetical protein E2P63_03910 [Candidatus Bathyarchaeota archaeon]
MNSVVLFIDESGGVRREISSLCKRNGWWVLTIYPKDFTNNVEMIGEFLDLETQPTLQSDVEYQFIRNKLAWMVSNAYEKTRGVFLMVDMEGLSKETIEHAKDDLGAFESKELGDISPKKIFEMLTKESWYISQEVVTL